MAVQDGYGKVSGSESLVFAYDLKDTINSYRGEPATNSQNGDISAMTQSGFDSWSCYDGNPPYHTWGINQSKTFVTIPGPFGTSVNAMLYHNFNGGFYGPTDWGAVPNGTITAGRTYTVQGWVKAADSASIGKQVSPYTYYSHSSGAYSNGTSYTLTDQWQLVSHTHTVQYNATSGGIMYFFTQNSGEVKMYLTMTGVFLDKSHAVQWLVGGTSRNDSDSLKDLTGNNTINIPAVSFDSSASMVFDGTNDYILLPSSYTNFSNRPKREITVLMVLKFNNFDGQQEIMRTSGAIEFDVGEVGGDGSGRMSFWIYDSGWQSTDYDIKTNVGTNKWFMVVGVYSNITNRHELYVNGTLVSNGGVGGNSGLDLGGAGSTFIGAASTGALFFNGEIKVCQIYNKPLTSTEISNNYLKYKRQYGLT